MTRSIQISLGEFYHVYNRGTDKRNIFLRKGDYERFLSLLYLCNNTEPIHLQKEGQRHSGRGSTSTTSFFEGKRGSPLVEIGAYCLMPNHFHILIRETTEGGTSKFMQKLTTAYTMYFNVRYDRNGALFQGRFKAQHASEDPYLKYLISYIHLNPLKIIDSKWKERGIADRAVAKKYLDGYQYSSYLDFIGKKRIERKILSPNALPKYFDTLGDFEATIIEWLSYEPVQVEVEPRLGGGENFIRYHKFV